MKPYTFLHSTLARVVLFPIAFLSVYLAITNYYGITGEGHLWAYLNFGTYVFVSLPVFLMLCAFLVFSEGAFSKTTTPYIILRRRLDEPGAPWEDVDFIILDYDPETYSNFYDYHTAFFLK